MNCTASKFLPDRSTYIVVHTKSAFSMADVSQVLPVERKLSSIGLRSLLFAWMAEFFKFFIMSFLIFEMRCRNFYCLASSSFEI